MAWLGTGSSVLLLPTLGALRWDLCTLDFGSQISRWVPGLQPPLPRPVPRGAIGYGGSWWTDGPGGCPLDLPAPWDAR